MFCTHTEFIVEVDGISDEVLNVQARHQGGQWEEITTDLQSYYTVDKLFENLAQMLLGNPVQLDIEFDPEHGFVSAYSYNGSNQIADDESQFATLEISFESGATDDL